MAEKIKFAYIAICFCLSLFSLVKPLTKKDAISLVAAMFFTLISDYSLIIKQNYTHGVFTFSLAHAAYIIRNKGGRPVKAHFIIAVGVFTAASFFYEPLISVSAAYAYLFAVNLHLSYGVYKSNKLPKIYRKLVFWGTALFALCDINVLLFNLQFYMKNSIVIEIISPIALTLAWAFYVPSQAALALSGSVGSFTLGKECCEYK